MAVLKADIRRPFERGKEIEVAAGVRHSNQSEAKRELQGLKTMTPVMRVLNLNNRWTLNDAETLKLLSNSVDVEVAANDEITIKVVRDSAQEAAEIANAVAAQATESLTLLDERKKEKSARALDKILTKEREPIDRALEDAAAAFRANDLEIVPTAETDLSPYMEIPEILGARVDLDAALENFENEERKQKDERLYWERALIPTSVVQPAVAPANFSGPDKGPIQREYALYGVTAGLILGLLLMFILWKLFSPKRG